MFFFFFFFFFCMSGLRMVVCCLNCEGNGNVTQNKILRLATEGSTK